MKFNSEMDDYWPQLAWLDNHPKEIAAARKQILQWEAHGIFLHASVDLIDNCIVLTPCSSDCTHRSS